MEKVPSFRMSSTTSMKASTARCEVKIKAPYVARPFWDVGTSPRLTMCWRTEFKASRLNLCSRTGTKIGAYPWSSQVEKSSSYVSFGADLVLRSKIGVLSLPLESCAILWLCRVNGHEILVTPALNRQIHARPMGRRGSTVHRSRERTANLSIICP